MLPSVVQQVAFWRLTGQYMYIFHLLVLPLSLVVAVAACRFAVAVWLFLWALAVGPSLGLLFSSYHCLSSAVNLLSLIMQQLLPSSFPLSKLPSSEVWVCYFFGCWYSTLVMLGGLFVGGMHWAVDGGHCVSGDDHSVNCLGFLWTICWLRSFVAIWPIFFFFFNPNSDIVSASHSLLWRLYTHLKQVNKSAPLLVWILGTSSFDRSWDWND